MGDWRICLVGDWRIKLNGSNGSCQVVLTCLTRLA
jgi:hypothetical protein